MSSGPIYSCAFLAVVMFSINACARAEKVEAPRWNFTEVGKNQATIDAYLKAAREADKETDPLQRCLKFPDLPGTKWPKEHVQSHCRNHFSYLPDLKEANELLDRGNFSVLNGLMNKVNERHSNPLLRDEAIHHLLSSLTERGDIAIKVKEWIEIDPKSEYAYGLQSIMHLRNASKARGERYASETSEEQFAQMYMHLNESQESAEKALSLSQNFTPAWDALADIARMSSDNELQEKIILHGYAESELCAEFARSMMDAIEPRWGGSYEQMQNYSDHLRKKSGRNELLRLPVYASEIYAAQLREVEFETGKNLVQEAVAYSSNETAMELLANWSRKSASADTGWGWGWEHAILMLQKMRFHDPDRETAHEIYLQLAKFNPEWAASYGELAETIVDGKHISSYSAEFHAEQMAEIYIKAGNLLEAEQNLLKLKELNPLRHTETFDLDQKLLDIWLTADEQKYPQKKIKAVEYANALIARHATKQYAWPAVGRYLATYPDAVLNKEQMELCRKNVPTELVNSSPDFSGLKRCFAK